MWPNDIVLDPKAAHIVVYFGEPLSHKLQSVKLQTFLSKVPYGDEWSVYVPDVYVVGGYHGALFSTNNRIVHGEVLDAVRGLKMQSKKTPDGTKKRIVDNQAYTNINIIDNDAYESSLKAAVEDDSLVEEYIELQKTKFVQQKVVRIVSVKDKNKLQSLPGFNVDVIGDNVRLSYPVMIPSDYHNGKELSTKEWLNSHVKWLDVTEYITDDELRKLIKQYEVDDELNHLWRTKLEGMVYYRYLKGACLRYGVTVDLGFKKTMSKTKWDVRIKEVHAKHKVWLESLSELKYEDGVKLQKLYDNDAIMEDEFVKELKCLSARKYYETYELKNECEFSKKKRYKMCTNSYGGRCRQCEVNEKIEWSDKLFHKDMREMFGERYYDIVWDKYV